jgi:hypothetical protein
MQSSGSLPKAHITKKSKWCYGSKRPRGSSQCLGSTLGIRS